MLAGYNSRNGHRSERADDYVAAKRQFLQTVIFLHDYLKPQAAELAREIEAMRALIAAGTEDFISDPNAHFPATPLAIYGLIVHHPREYPPFDWWEIKGWIPRDFGWRVTKDYEMLRRNRQRYESPDLPDRKVQFGKTYIFPDAVKLNTILSHSGYSEADRLKAWIKAKQGFRGIISGLRFWLWNAGLTPDYARVLQTLNDLLTDAFVNDPSSDIPDSLLQGAADVVLRQRAVEKLEAERRMPEGSTFFADRAFALLMRARMRRFHPKQKVLWGAEYVDPDGTIREPAVGCRVDPD
jgi:hypothetical protein